MIAIILSIAAVIVAVFAFIRTLNPHAEIAENTKKIRINQVGIANNKRNTDSNREEISNLYDITPKADKIGNQTVLTYQGEVIYRTENKKKRK